MTVTTGSDGGLPRWQRSMLPAMLGADHADRGHAGDEPLPRSARDWLVDIVIFVGACGLGAVVLDSNFQRGPTWLAIVSLVAGVPALGALWVRRRHPFAVGVSVMVISIISGLAAGAAIAAMFTAATYCRPRRMLVVLALALVSDGLEPAIFPTAQGRYDTSGLAFGLGLTIVAAVFGAFVRVRRELVLSLHERNRELQAEQSRRMQEARSAERTRIAREMHDVLAHRISLLAVHAGALEFNRDASPEEIARAAEVIRVSARAAQEELREVIGVLRTGSEDSADAAPAPTVSGAGLQPPQPTLADLRELVAESRGAGMQVRLDVSLDERPLPVTLGRTVYRVVQEALTNARKHAPDQLVTVELGGGPGGADPGIHVAVVNRPRVGHSGRPPQPAIGSGMGLVGLSERLELVGGSLAHGPLGDGGFALRAQLPWPQPSSSSG